MKKIKSLGPANDAGVPLDEVLLAKALQNVKVYGKRWCSGSFFVDKNGTAVEADITLDPDIISNIVGCCAMGACFLASDTEEALCTMHGSVASGNDNSEHWAYSPLWSYTSPAHRTDGESFAWAYRQAMTME